MDPGVLVIDGALVLFDGLLLLGKGVGCGGLMLLVGTFQLLGELLFAEKRGVVSK